ncbi:MAG: hypothetical protein WC867_05595 [Candidatus Pacearchaeota archaeon]|jgi:hypothetical protein
MKNRIVYSTITLILAFVLVIGSVSALTVPNIEAYKKGSVQFLPSRDIEGKSYFSANSMVGTLTIKAKDKHNKPFQMQLNINNDHVSRGGCHDDEGSSYISESSVIMPNGDIIVKGSAYGVWWTKKEFVSIDWVQGKYVIHNNGKIDVYVDGKLIVKNLEIDN